MPTRNEVRSFLPPTPEGERYPRFGAQTLEALKFELQDAFTSVWDSIVALETLVPQLQSQRVLLDGETGTVDLPIHGIPKKYHMVLFAGSGAGSYTLNTITRGQRGDEIILSLYDAAQTFSVESSGNISVGPFNSFPLLSTADRVHLSYDGNTWGRISSMNN